MTVVLASAMDLAMATTHLLVGISLAYFIGLVGLSARGRLKGFEPREHTLVIVSPPIINQPSPSAPSVPDRNPDAPHVSNPAAPRDRNNRFEPEPEYDADPSITVRTMTPKDIQVRRQA